MNHLTRPKSHTQHRNAVSFRSGTQLMTICASTNKMLRCQRKIRSSIFMICKFFHLVDGHYNCRGQKVVFWETMACFRQTGVLEPENADSRFLCNAGMRLIFYPEDKRRNFRLNAHSYLMNYESHIAPKTIILTRNAVRTSDLKSKLIV